MNLLHLQETATWYCEGVKYFLENNQENKNGGFTFGLPPPPQL